MNTPRLLASMALVALVSLAACDGKKEPASAGGDVPNRPAAAPDNTARNKGDASSDVKTPLDQSQSNADVKVTAEIRRAIMDDKAMSMNAQNCKIITDKSGMVTLRGVMDTQAEKDSIEAKAKTVAGVTKVDNQLEVKHN